MILSGRAIRTMIQKDAVRIEPLVDDQIEAGHVNLHLGEVDGVSEGTVSIRSNTFVLAKTKEKVTLPLSLCGFIEGRASLAKKGLSVEQSSTFIEPGSDNYMILEVFNASSHDIELTIGQPVAKMLLCQVVDNIE